MPLTDAQRAEIQQQVDIIKDLNQPEAARRAAERRLEAIELESKTPDPLSGGEIEKRRDELFDLFQPFFNDLRSQAQLSGQVQSQSALARARALGLPSELVDPGAIVGGQRRGAQTLQSRIELDLLDRALNAQERRASRQFQRDMFTRQMEEARIARESAQPTVAQKLGFGIQLASGIPPVQDFFGDLFKPQQQPQL